MPCCIILEVFLLYIVFVRDKDQPLMLLAVYGHSETSGELNMWQQISAAQKYKARQTPAKCFQRKFGRNQEHIFNYMAAVCQTQVNAVIIHCAFNTLPFFLGKFAVVQLAICFS